MTNNEEYVEAKYYKYVAEWMSLTYEEQCEVPLLSYSKWKKEKLIRYISRFGGKL